MDPATVPVANRDRGPKAATAGCSTSSFDAIFNLVETALTLLHAVRALPAHQGSDGVVQLPP